jgi:hypothetical protein
MLYTEIIAVCSDEKDKNHRHISASGTQNFLMLNRKVCKVSIWPSRVKPGGTYSNHLDLNGCDRRIMHWIIFKIRSLWLWWMKYSRRFIVLKKWIRPWPFITLSASECQWKLKTTVTLPAVANRYNILPNTMLIIYADIIWIVYLY